MLSARNQFKGTVKSVKLGDVMAEVVISVGVRRDGSVESSRILRSSGTPLLDEAALRVVQLAQPFPPLPKMVSAPRSP